MSMADEVPAIGPLVDYALEYAGDGREIFPVNPTNKTPLVSQHQATTNGRQIVEWWARWPDALIGHRLPADGLIIDIDPRHGGMDTWRKLVDELDIEVTTRRHLSGRGDGGGHAHYRIPEGTRLTIRKLDAWAKERGVGEEITVIDPDTGELKVRKWVCGLDLLHRNHRYSILPPSPHPETGKPYRWREEGDIEAMPVELLELVTDTSPPPAPYEPKPYEGESIADWYSATQSWVPLLQRHGWTLRSGDGDEDGSEWRHPGATNPISATTKNHCLFVYSPNTPFDVTEEGRPAGVTLFRAYAILEHGGDLSTAAKAARELKDGPAKSNLDNPQPPVEVEGDEAWRPPFEEVDWAELFTGDPPEADWLAEPLIPTGRQVALWASHKTGKSLLTLEVAAALATGRSVLSQPAGDPIDVVYCDMEMTRDDLRERLEDMGYGPDDDLSRLHYYLLPSLAPLDTPEGGVELLQIVTFHDAKVVILDTMSRVTAGEENSADTYRAYYRHTGQRLKALGVSVMRLDHGGKDPTRGQRGSSGKGDDIDVVWQLLPLDQGLLMKRTVSRISWVPESVTLLRGEGPLRHTVTEGTGWPAGTRDVANQMDELGIDAGLSTREAERLFRESGRAARSAVIRAAHRFRKMDTYKPGGST